MYVIISTIIKKQSNGVYREKGEKWDFQERDRKCTYVLEMYFNCSFHVVRMYVTKQCTRFY